MAVRNAIEDFHCRNLSDRQMRELNPIIRNAIFTAIYAMTKLKESKTADRYLRFVRSLIPEYWESPPTLLDEYRELLKAHHESADG